MKEWTDVVAAEVARFEARKREPSRWASAGCVLAAVAFSVFIDRAVAAYMGPSPAVQVLLIWVFAYLVGRLCWMALRPFIVAGLAVLLSSRPLSESPLQELQKFFSWAEAGPKEILASQFTPSTGITVALAFAAVASSSTAPFIDRK